MAVLNRDMLKEIKDELFGPKDEYVELRPGICVRVTQLTAEAGFGLISMGEKDEPEKRNSEGTLRWIAACCLDEQGNEVFTVDDLKKMPFDIVQKLAQAVNNVNGIASGDAIEEAEKNSGKARS